MTSLTYTEQVAMATETCCECSVRFAMPQSLQDRLRNSHKYFYCPNGHPQYYGGESDKDRAQRLAGQLDQERTRLQQERQRVADYANQLAISQRTRKAVSTRLRKVKERVSNGVCPCCNRTFQSLARHMSTKHPEFVTEGSAEV